MNRQINHSGIDTLGGIHDGLLPLARPGHLDQIFDTGVIQRFFDGFIKPFLIAEQLVVAGTGIHRIRVNRDEHVDEGCYRMQLGNDNGALECNVSLSGRVNNDEQLLLRRHSGSCLYPNTGRLLFINLP